MLTNKTLRSIITKVSLLKKSKLNQYGEVSEWFKELVLKTSDSARGRGFESHSLRQLNIFFHQRAYGEVPKWLKGFAWKADRSLIAARGFKSLLLRHFYQIRSWKKLRKKMKKYLTSLKRCDKISLAAEKAGANKTDP